MIVSTMRDVRQLHVRVHEEEGSLWATVDEFPGVFASGDDLDELRVSLEEGISLVLAEPGDEPPRITLGELAPELVATPELVLA